jgi:hypothetical protein
MGTPIPADQVIFDLGGCSRHSRHHLECADCRQYRDNILVEQRRRMDVAAMVADEYDAGFDTFPEA